MRVNKKEPKSFIDAYEFLGFVEVDRVGDEAVGDCVFCGGKKKLYINVSTGLFDCKKCQLSGNHIIFLTEFHSRQEKPDLTRLAEHRSLPVSVLEEADIRKYDGMYLIPMKSENGNVMTLQSFRLTEKIKLMNLAGIDNNLWGLQHLNDRVDTIVVCEGFWDGLACKVLTKDIPEIAVLSPPGAGTWKVKWNKHLRGKNVILIYDNDDAGRKGLARTWELLSTGSGLPSKLQYLAYPENFAEDKDLRDLYILGITWKQILELLASRPQWYAASDQPSQVGNLTERYEGERPAFEEVLQMYGRWLMMTDEHVVMLKIIYAIILTTQMSGDPLWMYLIGSPGAGKTELLMSTSSCAEVKAVSSVSPHSLVSGWGGQANDPSLIPALFDMTFVLKDFTEILEMPQHSRDEVYAILRGAFDGEVTKQYGNGIKREYIGTFNMVAGVTYAIDKDTNNSMGERFLRFRMKPHRESIRRNVIFDTLKNSGKELLMREELHSAAKMFLDPISNQYNEVHVPVEFLERIVNLAELVSVLRTDVERDVYQRDRLKYRPIAEVGTRIAKQLKKLISGLALLHEDFVIRESDMKIVTRVAMDTCTPFHLELLRHLISKPGLTVNDLSEELNIPKTNIRDTLDNLELTGVVYKQKVDDRTKSTFWYPTKSILNLWNNCEI